MSKIPFNWINWQQVLLDDERVPFHAKALGLFLHTYMNNSNDMAFPSVATICGRMNCTDKTVTKYTNLLVEFDYLVKHKRYGRSVQYIATTPSIVQDTIVSTVSDEIRSSIVRDTIPVSDEVRSNNQGNNQGNNNQGGKRKKFTPPTVDEVTAYCKDRKNGIDAEQFIDHYEANGWMRGKNKVKDWKACVRTWEKNRKPVNTREEILEWGI